jgi:hypothetical protein
VALVRPVFDVAADALPVCLIRVVPLKQHLKTKAERRVPDLFLAQRVDAPVDVFAWDHRLELFDPHEVLLVERPQPVDRDFQLSDLFLDIGLLHGAAPV